LPAPAGGGRGRDKRIIVIAAVALVAAVIAGLIVMQSPKNDHETATSSSTSSTGSGYSSTYAQTTAIIDPTHQAPSASSGLIVGTCDEGGSCGVKQRTAPYTDAPRMYPNDLQDNDTVIVVCETNGDVRSSMGHGSSSTWYRLGNGAYVNSV
jgi:serine/threonine-protein kinase